MIGTQHHLGAVLGQLLPWRKQVLPRSWGMASFLPSCRALLPGGVIELQHFPRVAASHHLTWERPCELPLEKHNAGKSTPAPGVGQISPQQRT